VFENHAHLRPDFVAMPLAMPTPRGASFIIVSVHVSTLLDETVSWRLSCMFMFFSIADESAGRHRVARVDAAQTPRRGPNANGPCP